MARSEAEARTWLKGVLVMDPYAEPAAIVAQRARWLGLSRRRETRDAEEVRRQRHASQRIVDELRNNVWLMNPHALQQAVATIELDQFPEFRPVVSRLHQAAALRGEFTKLAQHPLVNINLLNTVKRIMMSAPVEAGILKDEYLRKLPGSPSLDGAKKMVRTMRREFPAVFQLESDWFSQILRLKPRKTSSGMDAAGQEAWDWPIPGWVVILLVIFAIRLIFRLLF